MLKVDVHVAADELLEDLRQRGLVVKMTSFDAKVPGRHWHLGFDKKPGVLEVTDLGDRCELKIATNRDGGWASALAHELAR